MPYGHDGRMPPPPSELRQALQIADFADEASMRALQAEVTRYARALRTANVPQSLVTVMVRGLVDDTLSVRAIPIRTSEGRARLLALAADWSAGPLL